MDQVSALCRRRHLRRRTEEVYCFWIRRYILFHHKKHPRALGTQGIAPFVNHLAVDCNVAASTQSQALTPSYCCTATRSIWRSGTWMACGASNARLDFRWC